MSRLDRGRTGKERPGVKFVYYKMALKQYPDNGKTVGDLNGAPNTQHTANYHTWQPTFDVNYKLRQNWSTYVQVASGSSIPPSSIAGLACP
jgi:iron complex outermembrane recepter protein